MGLVTSSLSGEREGAARLGSARDPPSLMDGTGRGALRNVARPTEVGTPITISAARSQIILGAFARLSPSAGCPIELS